MSDGRQQSGDDGRLQRCIRDLAALNALPSMCIGRSPEEALAIVLDALPTALGCEVIHLALAGPHARSRAALGGVVLSEDEASALGDALSAEPDDDGAVAVPGGRRVWCLDAEIPIGGEPGRLVAGRGTPFEIDTDRVLVRSAANLVATTLATAHVLEAARRKDEFLAMLGHELRNPLAPILTAVEILARNPSAERERHVIERHTRHLARLVDDLLDISRVTRGHVELRRETVPLATVLERATELAAPLLARHRHTLTAGDTLGVVLEGDPVRLAQVFANLLTNAAKFTAANGRIDVAIVRDDARVHVAVRDNGRGIERKELDRIFEPFVQADRAHDSLRGGLGLGLAIVSNLVERHGGTIVAQSDGPGKGSSFTVTLPVAAAVRAPAPAAPPRRSPVAREGVRVLVVDDNVDVAELLSEALRLEGFETAIAHDARAALEQWRRFVPHAAILDVGMPEIDGYHLARSVRAEHGTEPTLIAATGYGQPTDRLRATDAGFDCHFVKPVSIRDIVHVLDERVVAGPRHQAAPVHPP